MIQRILQRQSHRIGSRISIYKQQKYKLSQQSLDLECDLGNITGNLIEYPNLPSDLPIDMMSKVSLISPVNIYYTLNDMLEYSMVTLGEHYGMGMAIVAITVGIKLVYTPLMIKTNINTLKLKLLEPETQLFQKEMKRLQQKQDTQGLIQSRLKFKRLRQKHGINMAVMALNFTQFPLLITWFLQLRYCTSLQEKFPGLKCDGFMWFQDLTVPDPYCVLPILSAFLSYYNITVAQSMQASHNMKLMQQMQQFIKYVPFLSIPIMAFFPSGLSLYWVLMSGTQLATTAMVRNQSFRRLCGVGDYLPGTILETKFNKQQAQVVKAIITDNINNIHNHQSHHKLNLQQVFTQKPKKKL